MRRREDASSSESEKRPHARRSRSGSRSLATARQSMGGEKPTCCTSDPTNPTGSPARSELTM